jgi:TolA-binding protein
VIDTQVECRRSLLCHGGHIVKSAQKLNRKFFNTPSLIQTRTLLIGFACLSLASCSWITSRRSLFGGDEEGQSASADGVATVPKSQFDALSRKYEALLKERQMENVQGGEANQMMNQMEGNKDPSDVVDQISKVKGNNDLAETVDVFEQTNRASRRTLMPVKPMSTGEIDGSLIEDHITKVRKAEKLVAQNKYDASINLIKELEKSPVRQVVVRAKFLMGEILFGQGEYDLALQVFEEILQNHAFSGLVIKTLGRLIVCSDKLKLAGKQEKYYSILHDFFEQGA